MAASLLKGTAFITGAASGIGKATAIAFAKHGIRNLALTDINATLLQSTSLEIKALYPDVEIAAIELDVRNNASVEAGIAETVNRFKRIDVALNIAGIGADGKKTHETESESWDKVVDVNLNGVWRCQRAELRAMLQQENLGPREGRGNIINVASMFGLVATPLHLSSNSYTTSKHAVVGLTKNDAITYAPEGIRINAICPGYVKTPFLEPYIAAGKLDSEIARTPMGRVAEPEEIADSIVYLASELASFVTGSALVVDGGYTAN